MSEFTENTMATAMPVINSNNKRVVISATPSSSLRTRLRETFGFFVINRRMFAPQSFMLRFRGFTTTDIASTRYGPRSKLFRNVLFGFGGVRPISETLMDRTAPHLYLV